MTSSEIALTAQHPSTTSPGTEPEPTRHAQPATHSAPRRPIWPHHSMWKHLGLHILVPVLLGIGMTLAYLGAFHEPTPHHLPVAIVGQGAQAQVFAEKLNDQAPDQLDVRTVATAAEARKLVHDRTLAGAFETTSTQANLYIATAASATTAEVVQKAFQPIAFQLKLPYNVVDVAPVGKHDATGQGIFFLLVGLSVGGYAVAAAVAAVTGKHGLLARVLVPVLASAVVSAIIVGIAAYVYHVFDRNVVQVWLISWLYDALVMWIGVALMPILRSWTVLAMTVLFVQLNFTSSGGIFQKALEPGFFAALNDFWAGAGWLNSVTALVYFPGQAWGTDAAVLGIWAGVACVAVLVSHLVVRHHERVAAAKAVAPHMAAA
ncbi:ABC-2 transporter permease [Gryllotalpicola ginsengisoli]|uniref:membrane protein n=1 Tax=Gryllotalpicola ginsengisoli TaxID=444608 RepID=UPI0003B41502|nr:membrane protein [Gryllotalpicola ginsengisoli]